MRLGGTFGPTLAGVFALLSLHALSARAGIPNEAIRWGIEAHRRFESKSDRVLAIDVKRSAEFFVSSDTIRGREAKGFVSFTFDDGPNPKTTPVILDILDEYRIPATFFVVGSRFTGKRKTTRQSAELLKDIVAKGHDIGNHTFSHENLKRVGTSRMASTISRTRTEIFKILGYHARLFRPPYGLTSQKVSHELRRHKYTKVLWNIDSHDYLSAKQNNMVDKVLAAIVGRRGGIVLFHDTKASTAEVLPTLFAKLERINCRLIRNGESAITPVSLHYFSRRDSRLRTDQPDDVVQRTEDYAVHLAKRCRALD